MKKTVKNILFETIEKLRSISDTPSLDASILFEKATNLDKVKQITYSTKIINEDTLIYFNSLVDRRLNYEPIAYIIGEKEFYARTFKVNKNTLIPRPDTETLVENVINYIKKLKYSPDILDLCTGTGCVGISIGLESNINSLTLSDISEEALVVARENANLLYEKKISIIQSNLINNCGKYDIIVSNPPYLTKKWCDDVIEDVKKEPLLALNGFGEDGLDIIRKIINESKDHFKDNKGTIFLECDSRQCNTVINILEKNNFYNIEIYKDLANKNRVVKGMYER